ncbi:hypothetical protein BB559_005170 [Furculomyces boomerangus]|uniref:Uncharacterized protein n=2 Tax=Harpellales TaxID=61421 RepID=A0A2T9YA76_9FUNG|nr:hypothetical protein BB559_005170 [Furculomyces boomerangus]PVZ98967.1 hypothetical protein BB558_005011 [Smittium angustum]
MPTSVSTENTMMDNISESSDSEKVSDSSTSSSTLRIQCLKILEDLKIIHRKATRALVLGRANVAWEHYHSSLKTIGLYKTLKVRLDKKNTSIIDSDENQITNKFWILYICIISSIVENMSESGNVIIRLDNSSQQTKLDGFPKSCTEVWECVKNGFGGISGNVDGEIIVLLVLFMIKIKDFGLAKSVIEDWIDTLPEKILNKLELNTPESTKPNGQILSVEKSSARTSYIRVCELYTIQILPFFNMLDNATVFVKENKYMSSPLKNSFISKLESLKASIEYEKLKIGKLNASRQPTSTLYSSRNSSQLNNQASNTNSSNKRYSASFITRKSSSEAPNNQRRQNFIQNNISLQPNTTPRAESSRRGGISQPETSDSTLDNNKLDDSQDINKPKQDSKTDETLGAKPSGYHQTKTLIKVNQKTSIFSISGIAQLTSIINKILKRYGTTVILAAFVIKIIQFGLGHFGNNRARVQMFIRKIWGLIMNNITKR